ncbi:nucleoside-diphosphate kinase [Candidatus Bipolaricaulota bacterium]|nr:nucleoside-diphosphate kinase [Candidatus Bipolaricaulota bacterium]MCK4411833.1 nucleoside-diphosphate kinase [Candidatus Bipolaricaulota bacterium]
MNTERTLVLCKPDTVQRQLVGRVISRLEEKGLKIVGLKMLRVDEDLARQQYQEHVEKIFFSDLVSFITASPVVAIAAEGNNAVEVVRRLMGATNPQDAAAGTIRGDFGLNLTKNMVHGSDSLGSAKRELALFFSQEELQDYPLELEAWL